MPETILIDREGRVAILTINRPDKLNALSQQVRDEVLAALDALEHDDGIGVIVKWLMTLAGGAGAAGEKRPEATP